SEWNRARRSGTELGLLLVDIDHFKAFNDQHGHPAGDRCLQAVGGGAEGKGGAGGGDGGPPAKRKKHRHAVDGHPGPVDVSGRCAGVSRPARPRHLHPADRHRPWRRARRLHRTGRPAGR
ncbi:diguanylate cyclase domain-containing protein, partial [Stenotrophomonas maltophilia]|uniref:diguanylate cyclase domain-containing protein n=1 Tax=Stenotrophomonas maltophilia TaxID=40324 RepID=UPI00215A2826